jgi:ribosomal protein S18 acetylase RimI-like enzyme
MSQPAEHLDDEGTAGRGMNVKKGGVIDVQRVRPDEWELLRDLRLRALAQAPDAFATTHAEALARPDEWWRGWAERSASEAAQAMFLARDGDEAVGIAGIFGARSRFDVISMWTDPAHRGKGVGAALLRAAVSFAGDAPVFLSVTEGNDDARRLYERHGFVATGLTEPLRSNTRRVLHELRLDR